ncbi:MAG: hypothetical protein MI892_26625 [Desulfobacterales bacterium]|nr:hypothetical protein [Desulfobacterales bacterium]
MTLSITVQSKEGTRFAQEIVAGRHIMTADRAESFGGTDSGPGPYSYLLAALGS